MSAAFTSIGLKPKQASKSLKYEAELRNRIFCDFLPQQTMQPSFDLITVSHKKQKEKNENNLEGKRINFAISLFTFLVASVESKRGGGKQTRTRALQARISGYFH